MILIPAHPHFMNFIAIACAQERATLYLIYAPYTTLASVLMSIKCLRPPHFFFGRRRMIFYTA
jgi:hypothetical protein